jgi:hypothetical protein
MFLFGRMLVTGLAWAVDVLRHAAAEARLRWQEWELQDG